MGYYFNPPEKLPDVACQIYGTTYAELKAQLKDGERLFGYYDRPLQGFQNAVWLFSAEEMEEFESQTRRGGTIIRLGFYAMPTYVFKESIGDIRKEQE